MKKKRILIYVFYLPLVCSLAGCSSPEDEALTRYIHEVKMRSPKPIEPVPVFVPLEKFLYPEILGRRNPFRLREVKEQPDVLAPNITRPKEPLEMFPLDALKFVGIWRQDGVIWGLISQPGGMVSRVKVGNYMGQNFGRIISISETSLKLEERVQVSGKWDSKITTFNLNSNE
ncbi:pilus assembly protein PilP [Legionella sp. CNM-4043-24]|uniref:pilus assembly protein PilP n=1 Tax=Legionella sp. CNM-4043-24 TaxID=3421646 RepID=UPI00403B13E8